jgi:hypothetical protein
MENNMTEYANILAKAGEYIQSQFPWLSRGEDFEEVRFHKPRVVTPFEGSYPALKLKYRITAWMEQFSRNSGPVQFKIYWDLYYLHCDDTPSLHTTDTWNWNIDDNLNEVKYTFIRFETNQYLCDGDVPVNHRDLQRRPTVETMLRAQLPPEEAHLLFIHIIDYYGAPIYQDGDCAWWFRFIAGGESRHLCVSIDKQQNVFHWRSSLASAPGLTIFEYTGLDWETIIRYIYKTNKSYIDHIAPECMADESIDVRPPPGHAMGNGGFDMDTIPVISKNIGTEDMDERRHKNPARTPNYGKRFPELPSSSIASRIHVKVVKNVRRPWDQPSPQTPASSPTTFSPLKEQAYMADTMDLDGDAMMLM